MELLYILENPSSPLQRIPIEWHYYIHIDNIYYSTVNINQFELYLNSLPYMNYIMKYNIENTQKESPLLFEGLNYDSQIHYVLGENVYILTKPFIRILLTELPERLLTDVVPSDFISFSEEYTFFTIYKSVYFSFHPEQFFIFTCIENSYFKAYTKDLSLVYTNQYTYSSSTHLFTYKQEKQRNNIISINNSSLKTSNYFSSFHIKNSTDTSRIVTIWKPLLCIHTTKNPILFIKSVSINESHDLLELIDFMINSNLICASYNHSSL
ncbi:hypothetical protein WA158_007971 [Blastocystis sp. Blastoise]